ncbi:MAG: nitroreductase/quinone reductase family protein [Anaerolineales bacterium]
MDRKPNAFQKFIHRFLMLKPVSAALAVILHRADTVLLRWTRGKHTVSEIVGLPIIQLTTLGAKSGQPRTMPLVSLFDGEKIALIGSNFGGRHNPGWYYNLKANPRCTVEVNGRAAQYLARQAEGEEREKYWRMAVSYYKGYDLYKARAAHRVIPVMILEPVK